MLSIIIYQYQLEIGSIGNTGSIYNGICRGAY